MTTAHRTLRQDQAETADSLSAINGAQSAGGFVRSSDIAFQRTGELVKLLLETNRQCHHFITLLNGSFMLWLHKPSISSVCVHADLQEVEPAKSRSWRSVVATESSCPRF